MHLGTWEVDDLLTFPANTHTAATGAATDADSVPSYRVYEDETGTAILTGSMAKLDDANTTGFYSEQLTLSAANGFEVGKCYTIYVSATVASVVGTMSHTFKVEAAPATAAALTIIDDFLDTEVAAIKAKTDLIPSDPADASDVAALIAAVQSDTNDIQTRLPAALVGGRMDASVGAMASDVVTAAAIAANAIGASELAADAVTEIQAAVAAGAVASVTGAVGSIAAGGITAASIATGAIDADALAADAVDEILDEVVEGAVTLRQAIRVILSFVGAKVTGGGTTTLTYRDIGDTKSRITQTVDSSGNRSASTLDGS